MPLPAFDYYLSRRSVLDTQQFSIDLAWISEVRIAPTPSFVCLIIPIPKDIRTIVSSINRLISSRRFPTMANQYGSIQLGPRPFWLIDQMRNSPLKRSLSKFKNNLNYFEILVALALRCLRAFNPSIRYERLPSPRYDSTSHYCFFDGIQGIVLLRRRTTPFRTSRSAIEEHACSSQNTRFNHTKQLPRWVLA